MAGTAGHAADRLNPASAGAAAVPPVVAAADAPPGVATHAERGRVAAAALEHALQTDPYGFELFEALRLLERVYPQRPRLGRSTRPTEDGLRLRQMPSLAFAPSDIAEYRQATVGHPAALRTHVLGLFGPNGPLPLHMTEYALERTGARDDTLVAFADVFHHRLLSLFYRAWADAQPTVHGDRPDEDGFRGWIGALVGLSRPLHDPVVAGAVRHQAGRMLPASRNAEGLRALLVQAFGLPVRVIGFVAEWMRLPADARLALGTRRAVSTLGTSAVLGAHVRGVQHRFRLRLGPLDGPAFRRFLPGGRALDELAALVRAYLGDAQAWDVELVLRAADVPALRLGRSGRMGLDTWIGHRPVARGDAHDVRIHPLARGAARRRAHAHQE